MYCENCAYVLSVQQLGQCECLRRSPFAQPLPVRPGGGGNAIQSNITHCDRAKLWLERAQESYIHTFTASVTARSLFWGLFFRGSKNLKAWASRFHSTANSEEHSKAEFGKKFERLQHKVQEQTLMARRWSKAVWCGLLVYHALYVAALAYTMV
jgi:hypothetical protein